MSGAAQRAAQAAHFDHLYAGAADPWNTAGSWYERRKRAVIEAVLPEERFAGIYEPGCGSGELTLALAARCERLVASDFCEEAVRVVRGKTAHLPHVEVRREALPEQWPALSSTAPPFELIVLAELCYYLDPLQLTELAALAAASLVPGGHLLACHWKKEFDDRMQGTRAMHLLIDRNGRLQRCACYEDEDFQLDLWRKV